MEYEKYREKAMSSQEKISDGYQEEMFSQLLEQIPRMFHHACGIIGVEKGWQAICSLVEIYREKLPEPGENVGEYLWKILEEELTRHPLKKEYAPYTFPTDWKKKVTCYYYGLENRKNIEIPSECKTDGIAKFAHREAAVLSRAAKGIVQAEKKAAGCPSYIDKAVEWIFSPDIFHLNDDFALQTAYSLNQDKILLKIFPLRKSPLPTLHKVDVVFHLQTMVKETPEQIRAVLMPSTEDPSCGELVFDLSQVSYIADRRVTIHLENEQFKATITHFSGKE